MSEPQIIITSSMFRAISTILTACGNADLSKEHGDDVLRFVRDAMSKAAQHLTSEDIKAMCPTTEGPASQIRCLNLCISEQLERAASRRRAEEMRENFGREIAARRASHVRPT